MPATMLTHNVYSVKCQTCDAEYVGKTKRAIAVRKKEHHDAMRLRQTLKSANAEHAHEHETIQEIEWGSMKAIDKQRVQESEESKRQFISKRDGQR